MPKLSGRLLWKFLRRAILFFAQLFLTRRNYAISEESDEKGTEIFFSNKKFFWRKKNCAYIETKIWIIYDSIEKRVIIRRLYLFEMYCSKEKRNSSSLSIVLDFNKSFHKFRLEKYLILEQWDYCLKRSSFLLESFAFNTWQIHSQYN